MNEVEFSQPVTDAIGIISVITFSLCIMFLVGLLAYHYFKVEKPKNVLEIKNLKLRIELNKHAVEWNKKNNANECEEIEEFDE